MEIGRIKKTTGIKRAISDLPARLRVSLLLDNRESLTCEIRIGVNDDPRSMPKIRLVIKRRNTREW